MFDSWRKARQQPKEQTPGNPPTSGRYARAIFNAMRSDLAKPKRAQLDGSFSAAQWHADIKRISKETQATVLNLAAHYQGQASGITLAARALDDVLGEGAFSPAVYHGILNYAFALHLTDALLKSNLPHDLAAPILAHLEERYFGNGEDRGAKPPKNKSAKPDSSESLARAVAAQIHRDDRRRSVREKTNSARNSRPRQELPNVSQLLKMLRP